MFNKLQTVIGPSILSADFGKLLEGCEDVLKCGSDSLHIDIMDGYHIINSEILFLILRLDLQL